MSNVLLRPLVEPREIRGAFGTLAKRMQQGGQPYKRRLGHQGGYNEGTIHWHARHGFWCHCDPRYIPTRNWCCFGTANPEKVSMVSITCEVNPPHKGFDRRVAGVFVRDKAGHVYLAHSGKIAGGRPGIGKQAFWDFYGLENAETVEWPDGQTSTVAVIGRIDGERLLEHVASFVQKVQQFKDTAGDRGPMTREARLRGYFLPEFEGKRRGYAPASVVEAKRDHGLVVNRLYEVLRAAGHEAVNDRPRDLCILKRGRVTHLLEVKTDTSTTSLYQGIGQLMLHGAAVDPVPKRILVLPDQPKGATRQALDRLGVAVLVFDWNGGRPVFPHLDDVLGLRSAPKRTAK